MYLQLNEGSVLPGKSTLTLMSHIIYETVHVQVYLGPISTSLSSLLSVRFGFSDSASASRGGQNNQRRTSFSSALRLLQPAAERKT